MSSSISRLVAVADQLRAPGGCPWDAAQTHTSLTKFLIEECYELVEAIEAGDRQGMLEELGDVLYQVVFHARIAQEDSADPFDLDAVAVGLTEKLVRRHPHVFADADPSDFDELWSQMKSAEKPERDSVFDGVPAALPALARAEKIRSRALRAGLGSHIADTPSGDDPESDLGRALLEVVLAHPGGDPEGALRRTVAVWEATLRAEENM